MNLIQMTINYTYYYGQESHRRNGMAFIMKKKKKKIQNSVLGYSLKNYKMIAICFQGKPFNITVIQVNAPTTNAEEAEVD